MPHREVGIIGYGSTPYDKRPTGTLFDYLARAAREALASAGVAKDEIDGLAVDAVNLHPDNAVTMAEQFGLVLSWAYVSTAGGAGPLISVMNAVEAVGSGRAKYALCVGGGAQDVDSFHRRIARFNRAISDYLSPHGFGGMPSLFAIIQRKHMEQYGTTREQLGKIAVDLRRNAAANENALLRHELTISDYLNARVIAEPLGLFDCVLPCSGAEAIVVGPIDRVEKGKGVTVKAWREKHNHPPGEVSPVRGGWELFRSELYDEADAGPDAMDLVQVYDDFPIMAAIQLEDLGFCRKGEVGKFIDSHSFTFDGSLPLNTGGGQLSCGQAGGAAGLLSVTEAVCQLRGEAGRRQVANARRALVSGFGMITYGHGLASAAAVLERRA